MWNIQRNRNAGYFFIAAKLFECRTESWMRPICFATKAYMHLIELRDGKEQKEKKNKNRKMTISNVIHSTETSIYIRAHSRFVWHHLFVWLYAFTVRFNIHEHVGCRIVVCDPIWILFGTHTDRIGHPYQQTHDIAYLPSKHLTLFAAVLYTAVK